MFKATSDVLGKERNELNCFKDIMRFGIYSKINKIIRLRKNFSSMHMGSKERVWAKKIEPVKTVEVHSFLLLTHNFLAIKTS